MRLMKGTLQSDERTFSQTDRLFRGAGRQRINTFEVGSFQTKSGLMLQLVLKDFVLSTTILQRVLRGD